MFVASKKGKMAVSNQCKMGKPAGHICQSVAAAVIVWIKRQKRRMASGIRSHDDQAWEGRTCGLLITGHEHFGNMDSGAVTNDNETIRCSRQFRKKRVLAEKVGNL